MENEELMNLLVNQASGLDKAWRRMVQKYVYDTREGTLQELFERDAREWANWRRIGVQ